MGRQPLAIALFAVFLSFVQGNRLSLNQRVFVQARAISFVDPTKHGFRIILHDSFMKTQLAPNLLPMLYVTAIPLKRDQLPIVKMVNPESIYDDKTVTISDLSESSWFYVCVEWENFSRHNETTGSDCRIYSTLDRMGKASESTIDDLGPPDTDISTVFYRFHSKAEFPVRYTLTLKGGPATPPARVFFTSEPSEFDGSVGGLRQFTNYGKLCVLEEPLVTGYTAMGRVVSGISISKCHFNDITTKDYELSSFEAEHAAYRTASAPSSPSSLLLILLLLVGGLMERK